MSKSQASVIPLPDESDSSRGSSSFVSSVNRDSLEPIAVECEGQRVHRAVETAEQATSFSASRGHPVWGINLDSRNVSLSIGGLDGGCSTSNHRHAYETLVYVIEGAGYSIIENERVEWQAGDAFYVAPWNWHQHFANEGERVRYIAATNLPLLLSLGQTVVRQEEHTSPEVSPRR